MRSPIALCATLAAGAAIFVTAGCASTASTQNINSVIDQFSKTNCHVQGTLSAQVGAVNPGSGVVLQTSIDCPNGSATVSASQTTVKASAAPSPPPAP